MHDRAKLGDAPPALPCRLPATVIATAARRWQADATAAILISNWENSVYEVTCFNKPFILRLGCQSARTIEATEAECEWLQYLANAGLPVPMVQVSACGRHVEDVRVDGHDVIAVLFAKAPGNVLAPFDIARLPCSAIKKWGRCFGRMHKAAVAQAAQRMSERRPHWSHDPLLTPSPLVLDAIGVYRNTFESCKSNLFGLMEDSLGFGLIHADLHGRNILYDTSEFTLIDFDDCQRHWFAYDLAVAIGWAAPYPGPTREKFKETLLNGYLPEYSLSDTWIESIDDFIRLRAILDLVLVETRMAELGALPALVARSHKFREQLSRAEVR